ncbi:L-ornithine N5-acetyltransferase NATA1 [Beta vulgaris subsp. vulgaris]|uniref:L-ornithine N5-acetyltransferase NATA1 n=1 Tax=Beta vulgaris subsp. vulgaris TaxID=3555 RepID=UPI0020369F4E|nr:L-ornithine N5-acetyltransferase NATA1 [Beta vulgaris subsp. vulgaris]
MAPVLPVYNLKTETVLPAEEQEQQSDHSDHILYVRVRLATDESDVPFIHGLIHKMAAFYHLSDECEATKSALSSTLFNSKTPFEPFKTVTVFLVEVSSTPFAPNHPSTQHFNHIETTLHLPHPINDPEMELFRTKEGTIIAGFVIFFPSYSTFLSKHAFHVEDLFVREGYRGKGFGGMLMKAVATQAVKMGYARMEWTVTTWNVASHTFYEKLGAHILQDWRIFRLADDALLSYGRSA